MDRLRRFFRGSDHTDYPTIQRKSKNDYTYQVLEQIDVKDLSVLLSSLNHDDLTIVAENLHVRLMPTSSVSHQMAEKVKSAALKLYLAGGAFDLASRLSRQLLERSQEILGRHFDNPSRRKIGMLTHAPITEFGSLRTKILYAAIIDGRANAAPLLLQEIFERPELQIALHLHNETPIDNAVPRREPSADLKQSRRERRSINKEFRSSRRQHDKLNRVANKLQKVKKKATSNETFLALESPQLAVDENTATVVRREHPHLTRYSTASRIGVLIGNVYWVHISFGKTDPEFGKTRPCVIIAVAPKYLVVRPIYTRASRYAGSWRAVVIKDWKEAGLDHESLVGDETKKVSKDKIGSRVGSLSIQDWNRICLGEVNEKSD